MYDPLESPSAAAPRGEAGARWLHYYAVLTAVCAWGLLVAGAMVTSTGSGLAVPDWPTTYGYNLFAFPREKMTGGIFFEHSHRLIASGVGLMTVVLAVWLWLVEPRRWLRMLGCAALLAVCAQGLLGALTVKYFLPTPVSVLHGCLAQMFFCAVILIAAATSPRWTTALARAAGLNDAGSSEPPSVKAVSARMSLRALTVLAMAAVFTQLVLGAIMRHTESGLAVPDFPLAYGQLAPRLDEDSVAAYNVDRLFAYGLPAVTAPQIGWHLAHRYWAVVAMALVVAASVKVLRPGAPVENRCHKSAGASPVRSEPTSAKAVASAALLLILVQAALGAWTVWSGRHPYVASAHVAVGAAVLAAVWLMTVATHRPSHKREWNTESSAGEAAAVKNLAGVSS